MADQTWSLERASFGDSSALAPDFAAGCGNDELLLDGLRGGEEWAYESLISRFQVPVYNLVCRLLKDASDAGDVVQEVFLKVFRKIGAFHGRSSLKTWIYRITVNEAHNHRRWHKRHRQREVGLNGSPDGIDYRSILAAPGRSPFERVLDKERHVLVEAALSRLNPTFRAAVVLRDVEDLSYEEIAEILQVPLGTVKSRILRGREALRKELEKQLQLEPAFGWTPQTVE